MTLHLVYRLYGGENLKGRPDFYSKRTSLASFLMAAEAAEADVVVLADGPIPADLRAMIGSRYPIVDLPGGPVGMRKSFVTGLKYPTVAGWPDTDLVYFCEDDYLHRLEAFVELQKAAQEIPAAGYFALYASTNEHPLHQQYASIAHPADWVERPVFEVDGHRWVNVPSTASTFGARVGTLRRDLSIFRQAMVPYPSRYLDHEMCLVFQGRFPYTFSTLFLGPENTRFRTGWRALASNLVLAPFRAAYQLRALTRRRRPHLLYAADPNLACHMETDLLAPGVDWHATAKAADTWIEQHVWPKHRQSPVQKDADEVADRPRTGPEHPGPTNGFDLSHRAS